MNNFFISKYKHLAIVLLAGVALVSCKKQASYDFNGDSTNKVFVSAGTTNLLAYSGYSFSVANTPTGIVGAVSVAFPVHTTLAATSDIQVKLAADNSLTAKFNTQTKGQAVNIPDGILSLSANLTIPAGQLTSKDSLKLSIPAEKLLLLAPGTYVIPIKIASVTGAEISANQNVTYVVFTQVATNCFPSPALTDVTGTLNAIRTGWVGTLDVTPTSGALANMFDAKTNTSWALAPSKACTLTVDLAASKTNVTALRINSSSTTYSINTAVVSSSADGVNWVNQGTATFLTTSAYEYVKFYSPVTARYFRLNITGWKSATQIILTEFDIYQ
jgi:hypothetical protein